MALVVLATPPLAFAMVTIMVVSPIGISVLDSYRYSGFSVFRLVGFSVFRFMPRPTRIATGSGQKRLPWTRPFGTGSVGRNSGSSCVYSRRERWRRLARRQ